MTYTSNVPQSNQSLGGSQPIINANFTLIGSNFAENHVGFGLTNAGLHTFVDLVSQGTTASNPATGVVSHYANAVNGVTEWFFQREESGMTAGAAIQMSVSTPVVAASGRTFLPGALLMIWGTKTWTTASPTAVSFQGGGFPNACLSVQVTSSAGTSGAISLGAAAVSETGFNLTASGSQTQTGNAYYLAIGY